LPISTWELVVGSLVQSQEAHRRFLHPYHHSLTTLSLYEETIISAVD
jgi:hypothetical protein